MDLEIKDLKMLKEECVSIALYIRYHSYITEALVGGIPPGILPGKVRKFVM